ncbi:hypothetical protein N7478_005557 [Penicillium angulare]|uniref:uncharacterized protein n=1 Tax=Penicillium angulare TaxID=116970 RepID=UPI002541BBB4|nr:uncharacterized protein N7478_005557 [Penicillium angulare]KAJ5280185.1 hypothetical protein N7478_005557 [Penicillium angulare]
MTISANTKNWHYKTDISANQAKNPTSPFIRLPPELRLKIYQYALTVPNEYINKPLIVIHDRGNVFTSRNRYKSLSICPSWLGEDGTTRNLLTVNHQIHDEAEGHLYSSNTLFFQNSFDLDHLDPFLDTLSTTALQKIRSVGFEILLFVHGQPGVPKRTLKQYTRAKDLILRKLPHCKNVLFYVDPNFYYPTISVGGPDLAARGVIDLARTFNMFDITFYPGLDWKHLEEARQLVWRSSSPERRAPRDTPSSRLSGKSSHYDDDGVVRNSAEVMHGKMPASNVGSSIALMSV